MGVRNGHKGSLWSGEEAGHAGTDLSVNRTRTTPCSPPTGPSCSPPAHHLWAYHCTPPLHPRSTYHPSVPGLHGHLRGPAHYPSPPEIPRESPVNTSHLIQQPCQAFELPCSGRCLRCGGRRVRRLRLSDQRLTHQADDQPVALDGAHALLQLEQDGVLVLDVAAPRLPMYTNVPEIIAKLREATALACSQRSSQGL